MILSDNKDNDLFIDNNLIENSFKNTKNQLTELEIKAKEVPKQKDRLSKSLFRAAYELTADAPSDIFAQITNELALQGFKTLTKEKLKEKMITFMTMENRPYIQDVIGKVLFSAVVKEILNATGSSYDVKFVLYNGVNLAPIVINHSSCPVQIVVFAVEFNDNACKLCTVTPITDRDFLQICQDEENKEEQENEQELDMESEKDKHGREHVLYPHRGPSIVYLRNNFLQDNTCLEHVNDLYPICCESRRRGKTIFIVIASKGPDYNASSYKNSMLYAQLWKESGLDLPAITENAPGWSAMNPIEHLWSRLSSSLTSVQLRSSNKEDGTPPSMDRSLSKEEQNLRTKKFRGR